MQINKHQREVVVSKTKNVLGGKLQNKKIAIWGLSFKANTDDIRESPSIDIINLLLKRKAKIQAYDPIAASNTKKVLGNKIRYSKDLYACARGADVLIVATPWPEFAKASLNKIKSLLREPNIVDARNIFEPEKLKAMGFNYVGIGR